MNETIDLIETAGRRHSPVSGFEFIEFTAAEEREFANLEQDFRDLGFRDIAQHRSKRVQLFRQGGINLIVNREPSSFAHSFGLLRGISVCAVALRVASIEPILAAARQLGIKSYHGRIGAGEREIPALVSPSGRLIYLVEDKPGEPSIYDCDFNFAKSAPDARGLTAVDHISQSLGAGETRAWLHFYRGCFDLRVLDRNVVRDPGGYVLSTVIGNAERTVQFCLNEPIDEGTDCDVFVHENLGEGVQHIAFSAPDLADYLDGCASPELPRLRISPNYYHDLLAEGYDPDLVDGLKRRWIMLDTEGGGQFLHTYIQPANERLFFEAVERRRHLGFGRHDVSQRLSAQQERANRPQRSTPPGPLPPEAYVAPVEGAMRLFGVVGEQTDHLRLPKLIDNWFTAHGANATVAPMQVEAKDIAAFVRGARALENLIGFVVAAPHKSAMLGLVDEASAFARSIGAVNAVRRDARGRLVGDLFDGLGFIEALRRARWPVEGASVLIVGAGAAGRAIAWALGDAGVRKLYVDDVSAEAADRLVAEIAVRAPQSTVTRGPPADPTEIDLAINATPSGQGPDDPLPFNPAELRKDCLVAELLLIPTTTRLIALAQAHGCPTLLGREMVEGQIEAFAGFFNWTA